MENSSSEKYIGVPISFFGNLLDSIDNILQLKYVIRAIFILNSKKKNEAFIIPLELEQDLVIRREIAVNTDSHSLALARVTLDKCVDFGLLKQTELFIDAESEKTNIKNMVYFLTNDFNRMTQERLDRILKIARDKHIELESFTDFLTQELPNELLDEEIQSLFELYESNIGLIYPLAAEKLQQIENEYPYKWIVEAFSLAVSYNKRNLAYIEAILRRWQDEGRGNRIDRGDSGSITIGEIAKRQQRRKQI